MKWKRAAALLLMTALLLSLSACSDREPPVVEPDPPAPPQGETNPPVPAPAPTPADPEPAPQPEVPPVELDPVQLLGLQKQNYGLYHWDDADLLVRSEYSHVTLWFDDGANHPELAQALEQTAGMVRKSMEEEYDNLCASLPMAEPAVSTLDIQVRRADSVAVCLLSDSYSDFGMIEDFRGMHGTAYDAKTGQQLALTDVVTVNQDLTEAVIRELNRHQWAGDLDYRAAVEAYFANTPQDGIGWSLDYNGVTFYFADGDLEDAGNGRKTATVSFAEYPQLFEVAYRTAPEAYMVEFPLDSSFFTDLDGDGDLEELNVTAWYNSDVGMYEKYGIYTEANGSYHYEECYADGFEPYYVKTADGGHFLYLFCAEGEGLWPRFTLKVFDISGGTLKTVGEMQAGPGYIPNDCFRIPTDPALFYLDSFESLAQDMMPYAVGADGMPRALEQAEPLFEAEGFIEYGCYDEMLEDTTWWGYADVDPQSGESRRLAEGEVVLVFLADKTGSLQREGEILSFNWSCLEDGMVCLAMENGGNYYLTLYEDGIEDSGMYWMQLMLEERLVWLY